MPGTRKLGRATDSRKAMLRAMVTYLFENGQIETTVTRAKEVRSMAEKMITLGKQDTLHAKRQIFSYITKETVAKKVYDEIAPKYADRDGGYTRIIRIGTRRGDAAEMAIIELV
jgi:ribosomal protein L17